MGHQGRFEIINILPVFLVSLQAHNTFVECKKQVVEQVEKSHEPKK